MTGAATRPERGRRGGLAPHTTPTPGAGARTAGIAAAVLAVATVGLQIAYPPSSPATRSTLSVVTVLVFAAAGVADALRVGGVRAAGGLLASGAVLGGAAEVLGVHTGWPFGAYAYTGTLGPQALGVPLVVPLAWTMATWPAWRVAGLIGAGASLGRRSRRWLRWLGGTWALASWDLFLDPQMVAGGHWRWLHPRPALPGIDAIPLSNDLGWLLTAAVVVAALEALVGRRLDPADPPGLVVGLLAGWTWIGGIVANAVFFHRPGVALVGGVAMGLVAIPVIQGQLAGRRPRAPGERGPRLRPAAAHPLSRRPSGGAAATHGEDRRGGWDSR